MGGTGWFFSLCMIMSVCLLNGQQGAESAFSKSYSFEYEQEYGKAITALLEVKTESYQQHLRLGWLYYLNKDYQKSESHYRKAVQLEGLSVEARFGLALPLSALGNYNQVLEVYQQILAIDPQNSIANYRTASIYYNRKDMTKAAACVLKVIKMYPFDYDSNLLYGRILQSQGKTTEARKYFEKALQYNPQSDDAKNAIKNIK